MHSLPRAAGVLPLGQELAHFLSWEVRANYSLLSYSSHLEVEFSLRKREEESQIQSGFCPSVFGFCFAFFFFLCFHFSVSSLSLPATVPPPPFFFLLLDTFQLPFPISLYFITCQSRLCPLFLTDLTAKGDTVAKHVGFALLGAQRAQKLLL